MAETCDRQYQFLREYMLGERADARAVLAAIDRPARGTRPGGAGLH